MSHKSLGYRNDAGGRVSGDGEPASTPRSAPWRWFATLTRARRVQVINGVRYEELDPMPLRRALSRGLGKRFRVRFQGGAKMVIDVSGTRPIADLMGTADLGEFSIIDPLMRPGDRVLLLHAGTGYGGEWLSNRLGPTGALVALEPDSASVRYARHRYNSANTAMEACELHAPSPPASLAGELDGAFDGIIHRRLPADSPVRSAHLAEAWRLLAPGGALAVLLASPSGHHDPREDPRLPELESALKDLAREQPPGIERMERVRVHARCGVLMERSYGDDDEP